MVYEVENDLILVKKRTLPLCKYSLDGGHDLHRCRRRIHTHTLKITLLIFRVFGVRIYILSACVCVYSYSLWLHVYTHAHTFRLAVHAAS